MLFLLQSGLYGLLCLIAWLIAGRFHQPLWEAWTAVLVVEAGLWVLFLDWQSRHPEWWPPWDEGLPQTSRIANLFVPVLIAFFLTMVLVPVFVAARHKALLRHHRTPVMTSKYEPLMDASFWSTPNAS